MQRLAPGHPQAPALADREVLDPVVASHHAAVRQHDLPLPRRQVGIEEGLHRAVMVGQAEILAFGLVRGSQTETLCLQPRVGFGELPERKYQPAQHRLRKVVEEVALVLVGIETAQQLMASRPRRRQRQDAGIVRMTHPGVVARGDPFEPAFGGGPGEHRAELHLPVAAGTGEGGHPVLIALHQEINDPVLEMGAAVQHVMGNAQLFADPGGIHQSLGAAGSLAAHQPERQPLHLPARLQQQGGAEGAVDTAGETHRDAVLAGPGTQALDRRGSGRSGGRATERRGRIGAGCGTSQTSEPRSGERTERSGLPIMEPRPPAGSPVLPWPAPDADHLLVTAGQMAELERQLFAAGLPVEALMEKAALQVSRRLLQRPEWLRDGVLVLVGPGHNGGDGLVVARELHLAGHPVRIWSPFERHRPLTDAHLRHALWLGIAREDSQPDPAEAALWIDALFGIGQNRPPGESIETLLARRQHCRPGRLAAIDTPTGLCADSGRLLGQVAACARITWCLGLLKQGLVQDSALAWVGELERVDLGLPARLLATLPPDRPRGLGAADLAAAPAPQPPVAAAKYARGRLLVVSGSSAYRGAALLSLLGASASGCGSLRAALPAAVADDLWTVLPQVVIQDALPCHSTGGLDLGGLAQHGRLERLDAVLLGPGIGAGQGGAAIGAEREAWEALQTFPGLLLLDADGLNRLADGTALEAMAWLRGRCGPSWLTPHGGEFGRLFPDLAGQPPLEAAAAAARRSGCSVLLKGARSVIASPDGRRWQLLEAAPAAARAGLGDVLAGYAAGLGARALAAAEDLDAAVLAAAALEHAQAGLDGQRSLGSGSCTPQAIATLLGGTGASKHTESAGF